MRNVPEYVIEQLFARMASLHGSRFLDLWRDCDIEDVKKTWREGIAKDVSDEGFKRGLAALFYEKAPPSLPRFIELCRGQTMSNTSTQKALIGPRVITPAAREALDAIAKALAPLKAKVIITRCACNDDEPARVPSPHIYGDETTVAHATKTREPGEDDE
jgi:hypothetical protein